MDFVVILILLFFGVIFGIISSIAGIGGGAFYMSLMVLLFAIPINEARDTSAFIIVFFSGVAFLNYFKQGKVDIKLSLVFAGFSLLGGITATIFFTIFPIDNTVLIIIIASIVLVSGLNMIRKALGTVRSEGFNNNKQEIVFSFENLDYKCNMKKGIPLFFLVGFIAYLSGIGGGMLFVPILSFLFGIPIHYATAMSTSIIFFIGIYNATVRIIMGGIQYLIGILIAIGAIIGSIFGLKLSGKMPKSYLQLFVAIILMILAIRMYFV